MPRRGPARRRSVRSSGGCGYRTRSRRSPNACSIAATTWGRSAEDHVHGAGAERVRGRDGAVEDQVRPGKGQRAVLAARGLALGEVDCDDGPAAPGSGPQLGREGKRRPARPRRATCSTGRRSSSRLRAGEVAVLRPVRRQRRSRSIPASNAGPGRMSRVLTTGSPRTAWTHRVCASPRDVRRARRRRPRSRSRSSRSPRPSPRGRSVPMPRPCTTATAQAARSAGAAAASPCGSRRAQQAGERRRRRPGRGPACRGRARAARTSPRPAMSACHQRMST